MLLQKKTAKLVSFSYNKSRERGMRTEQRIRESSVILSDLLFSWSS